jgi:hypothetical protein
MINKLMLAVAACAIIMLQACGDFNINTGGGDFFVPTVNTDSVFNVGSDKAALNGTVKADGGAEVSARGFVWSKQQQPNIKNATYVESGKGEGAFSANITGLEPSTLYYVRAYATNQIGTAYGKQLSFTTKQVQQDPVPAVSTLKVEEITLDAARVTGEITSGNSNILKKGFVWDIKSNPDISLLTRLESVDNSNPFSSNIGNLMPNTTYYIRAFATNQTGTGYGNELSFKTSASITLPELVTRQVSGLTSTSAASGGNITSDGGSQITSRGVVWSLIPSPEITNSSKTQNGTGPGEYSSSLTNLQPNKTYYVRAYAENSKGVSYGQQISFLTPPEEGGSLPVVTTAPVIGITKNGAISGGNVSSDGGLQVTSRGVVWSLNPQPSLGSGSKTDDGAGKGSFVSVMSGLFPATKYYARAYAINSKGISYGAQVEFTTTN